jgi:hypothetical protein
MSSPSDLIDHFKLNVDFCNGYVSQASYTSDHAKGLRRKKVETKWYRLRTIGEGACEIVWLEVDREGKEVGAERAVKEIRKSRMRMFQIDIKRELLAMAKLSKACHTRIFLCFLTYQPYTNLFYSTKIKDSSPTYLDGLIMMKPFSWLWNIFHMEI